ncbi:MAG TPA: serine hydrolase [Tepidisphaeraceae bacterium]|nr:serine hydrolase [Tepidisphaeraceae bacterium]
MNHTQIQGDHHRVIQNLADSYRPGTNGNYEAMSLSDSTVGETGVVTDVEDLARWDENFYDSKVGGQRLIAQMQEPGRLGNGQRTRYAAGLGVDQYRGLTVIEHSGSIAAYRSHYLRAPACNVSVIVLSNAEDLPATDLAHRVADIVLADRMRPNEAAGPSPASKPPANLELPTSLLDAYAGDYQLAPNDFAPRFQQPPVSEYVGDFYSPELRVIYGVEFRQGQLCLEHPRGRVVMTRATPDSFDLPFPLDGLRFQRDQAGHCVGFVISGARAKNVAFRKVDLPSDDGTGKKD